MQDLFLELDLSLCVSKNYTLMILLEANLSISFGMGNEEISPYECNCPYNWFMPSFHQSQLSILTL